MSLHPALARLLPETATPRRVLCVDLGQANDYTAIIAVHPTRTAAGEPPHYDVAHIERVPLNTRYPVIVRHLTSLVALLSAPIPVPNVPVPGYETIKVVAPDVIPEVVLVVDYTGVGRPVYDMILEEQTLADISIPVTITGGERVKRDDLGFGVPKRDLASVVQRLLQEGRLHLPVEHPMTAVLTAELGNFRIKISPTGRDTYGAGADWREGNHDDLVLSLALGCWYAETVVEVNIW